MASAAVQCEICPRRCVIPDGWAGDCRVRVNRGGRLLATTFGRPCALSVDPIEKKPFFHFLPGSRSFSIATAGCNLHCKNCQNWAISQAGPLEVESRDVPPTSVVDLARRAGAASVAYTYSEPIVFYEYVLETGEQAREAGLRSVLVTAGYIRREPLRRLCRVLDAVTLDVKFMDDALYRSNCDGALAPVLDALVTLKEEGVWLEVSNLVIPTLNDTDADFRRLSRWMVENLGRDTPLHFLRFLPLYRLRDLPQTPAETLERASAAAREAGVRHCYIGNVWGSEGETTRCPHDGRLLIRRVGLSVTENHMTPQGTCPDCGEKIAGVWQ